MSIEITVKDRKEQVIATFTDVEIGMTVAEFRSKFCMECDFARQKKLVPQRARFTINEMRGEAMTDLKKPLSHYVQDPTVTMYFKDLGPQIGWDTVFYVEYAGPIVITLLMVALRMTVWEKEKGFELNQKLGVFMVLLHYFKRELETAFVHRFSSETMPLSNIFKNSFHYFILFGFGTMFFYLAPWYKPPSWATDEIFYAATGLFCLFEFLNLMTHITLRNLRSPGSIERKIPYGWGFGMVSSANYLWETCAWLVFCVQAQLIGGYIFLVASIYQMTVWALKKHKRYRQEFPDYPRNRKAIFPCIL